MNKSEKTLVILSPGFPDSEDDTNCLPLQQALVKALRKKDPTLHIVILSFQYPYHKREYQWFGCSVTAFDGRNRGGFTRLLLRRRINAAFNKILRSHHVIGLLSFWYGECAWVGKKLAAKHEIKHYCWLLGQDARKENKYPGRIKPRADELVALSDFLQDEFEKNHGVKPRYIIPAALDTGQFSDAIPEKDILILAAGSLIPLKQYDLFVEIIFALKKEYPFISAALAGDGPEKNKLKELIKARGLDQQVRLTGELPHPDLCRLMERTKVFLHPSSYEGFSGVCLEALYAGAQVISFTKPMHHDIDHWHVVRTPKEMVKKTLSILNQHHAKPGRVLFGDIDDTAQKIMALYPSF